MHDARSTRALRELDRILRARNRRSARGKGPSLTFKHCDLRSARTAFHRGCRPAEDGGLDRRSLQGQPRVFYALEAGEGPAMGASSFAIVAIAAPN